MNNQVIINKDSILEAYYHATEEQKELLRGLFGKDIFKPKDIRERIKTFADACYVLGDEHELVRAYNNLIVSNCMSNDIIAYAKLRIIAEALNEGWKPPYDKGETKYYPLFYSYPKLEYDKQTNRTKIDRCSVKSNTGDRFYVYVSCTYHKTYENNSSKICLKTQELAEYCGKQFIDIWAEFLFA